MSEPLTSASVSNQAANQPRALRILAKSTFRELKSSGYSRSEILAFATEMLSLVSTDLRENVDAAAEE
ncbi:MAG: hypothetical protein K1X94_28595 [Sandaracinaceae bacterium]|jgi:hypothetical protein|nr:hypothetical protein [Sandaracinaceae bacterium]